MLISSFYHFTFSQPVYHPLQNKKDLMSIYSSSLLSFYS
ncbi:hypothetical protein C2W58_02182 [Bacillus pumilus]|uniref:Uncharacterized protein n=1 Tax=Bacillus pumilus TaxID=1408 RepID=A0AB34QUJ8_BACPU|nr:hypothetical protein B4127_0956 [Bacillus pumilus]RAP04329.1 hypothetical protein C2W58_02182 [Bacillus pumilus]